MVLSCKYDIGCHRGKAGSSHIRQCLVEVEGEGMTGGWGLGEVTPRCFDDARSKESSGARQQTLKHGKKQKMCAYHIHAFQTLVMQSLPDLFINYYLFIAY